jgi:sugar transferase EpsL
MEKRGFDVMTAAAALALLAPILACVWLLVRLTLGPPAIFSQQRAGLHGLGFTIFKFRTMTTRRNRSGALLPDADRLTRLGGILRSTSLDELPELWNVVRGDMSLVGPRPLPMPYLQRYTREQSRRHDVRPGITGWAQVSGRNALTWDEKFRRDVWYVENQSFSLDMKILLMTVWKLVTRDGISQPGHVTASEFLGSSDL